MTTVTPARRMPGAYINTPARGPVRRRIFGGSSGASRQPQYQLQPSQEQAPSEKAAGTINRTLQKDDSYPDLDSYCRPGASSDYEVQNANPSWAPFKKVGMYNIPDQVFDLLNKAELNTKFGLFTEINHAWVVIDSDLFLWDYTHPSPELLGFEEATHLITAVALVPPKPSVFAKSITHILVVATWSDVFLVGVAATDSTPSGSRTVTLYQTRMSVPRGSNVITIIAGTATGRIFYGGPNNTDIHELYYQQEEKWFSGRCGKINHSETMWSLLVPQHLPHLFDYRDTEFLVDIVVDDSRNLVYSLSSKSKITTYHMETPEKLTQAISITRAQCLEAISHLHDQSDLITQQTEIISISPISDKEAAKLHLMALTDTGVRLFLSATVPFRTTNNTAPQSMQVHLIKFPPSDQPPQEHKVPGPAGDLVDRSLRKMEGFVLGRRWAPGYFFGVIKGPDSQEGDMLFVSAPDTGRINNTPVSALKYFEQCGWIDLGSKHRIMAMGRTTDPFAAASQPLGFGNELAVQYDQAPSEFAVLTSAGVHIIRRRRLVEILATVIRNAAGDDGVNREALRFISQYGRVETVSAALAVACGHGSDTRSGTSRPRDQLTEDRARGVFIEHGGRPTLTETDGNNVTEDAVRLSSRHDALVLYLARLVRRLWKAKVICTSVDVTGSTLVTSTVAKAKLTSVQENIERLKTFLKANEGLIQGLSRPSDRASSKQLQVMLQREHQALHALRQLMGNITEGISFLTMLFDEQLTDIFLRLDENAQVEFREMTYEKLFSLESGRELAKVLVKAIVNRNIANGSNVETVADALRRRCGSFCSPDDVVIFKAQEQIQRASEPASNPNVRRKLLAESLRLFQQVAGSLTPANLQGAVEQYVELEYWAGAIQLCLAVAKEKDRGNAALSWFDDGRPENDTRSEAFNKRQVSYDLIRLVLVSLDEATASASETVDGRISLAATKRNEAYDVVNKSDDVVFHFTLYEWYIERQWTDRILAIDSPHVVTYLERLAASDLQHADLLCRYYTHHGRFFDAAEVQAELSKGDFAIGIKDRITLLSKAKANASVTTNVMNRERSQLLNHEVTDLLEIAHIQDDLLERLRVDDRVVDRMEEIERDLDGQIKSLSELYNNYADQAGYHDICLLIYHAADYQNPRAVTEMWERLIEEEHAKAEERQGEGADESVLSPWETVSDRIQKMVHRTSLDSLIFPVESLFSIVCAYAVNHKQDASIGANPCWPVLLFTKLGVPNSMIVHVLEGVLEGQDAPFTGRRRKVVVDWIQLAIAGWLGEQQRRGPFGRGSDGAIGSSVEDLLVRCEACLDHIARSTRQNAAEDEERQEMMTKLQNLRRKVKEHRSVEDQGSLFR